VRKQYHFWPGEGGLDAWDVDHLIELSRNLPVVEVRIDALRDVDSNYWFDALEPTVRRVAQHVGLVLAVDPSFPIILSSTGRVMDGMHRVVRAMVRGNTTISAVQFMVDPEPDYRDCTPDDLPY
jgi:hypothetical protein